eukprot:670227-Rhodomonas_salina.1
MSTSCSEVINAKRYQGIGVCAAIKSAGPDVPLCCKLHFQFTRSLALGSGAAIVLGPVLGKHGTVVGAYCISSLTP